MKHILLTILLLFGLQSFGQADLNVDSLASIQIIKRIVSSGINEIKDDSLTLIKGRIFSEHIEHKYVRYSNFSGTYIQIYSSQDDYKKPIFIDQHGSMNFICDSLFDVNGDCITDIAIHWYPSSGCCLADVYDCYIYNKKNDSFFTKNEIINPTFFPNKSKTYMMDYNHPGETVFYELKWNKSKVDTLTSYSWSNRRHDHVIITDLKTGKKMISKEIPPELLGLNGIEWFRMKPYGTDEEK